MSCVCDESTWRRAEVAPASCRRFWRFKKRARSRREADATETIASAHCKVREIAALPGHGFRRLVKRRLFLLSTRFQSFASRLSRLLLARSRLRFGWLSLCRGRGDCRSALLGWSVRLGRACRRIRCRRALLRRFFRLLFLLYLLRGFLDAGELAQDLGMVLRFARLAEELRLEEILEYLVELWAAFQSDGFEFHRDSGQRVAHGFPLKHVVSNLGDGFRIGRLSENIRQQVLPRFFEKSVGVPWRGGLRSREEFRDLGRL